jgi:filamentous hemagglutinin family protein
MPPFLRLVSPSGSRTALLASASIVAILAGSGDLAAKSLGGRPASPSAAAMAAGQAAQLEASRAAREAQNALKRATLAIQAMQASQQAARDAARLQLNAIPGAPPIPNGIGQGGLNPLAGGLWQGAKALTADSQTTVDGRTKVTIDQDERKAILTWDTFNIGRNTDLQFDQDAGDWVALNRVMGSAAPSQILGTLKAKGSVYVINQNGIIFGGASQINVGTLVASSLSLSNEQFLAGINTSLSGRIGGSAIDLLPTFGSVPQTLSVNAPAPAVGGNVDVRKGAQITTGTNGLIGLFGTNVTNSGTLATKGGQVLIAAGEQVRLVPQAAGSLIGLRAYVSALPSYYNTAIFDPAYFEHLAVRTAQVGMVVTNDGMITAEAGNITVVGSTVMQNGILRAVTTLDSPGSIMIAAEDSFLTSSFGGIKRRGGTVVFGDNSITQVVVDRSGIVGTGGSAGNSSILRISGKTVELQGKAEADEDDLQGAYVQAQGGKIDIDLRDVDSNFNAGISEGFDASPQEPHAGTRFLMNAGATLDVSGVFDVEVPMDRNSVLVEVRANELRDSPLQRNGILKGKKIWVDRRVSGKREDGSTWYGTELVDANDYIANIPTSMAERAVKGGSITIHAKETIVKSGSKINIGGGSTRYLDGYIRTTKLVGADGRLYDVGSADPDLEYIAIGGGFTRTNAHQGVTETWYSPLGAKRGGTRFEKGYTEGADAGTLSIHAPAVVLDGEIYAQAIIGERQIGSPAKGGKLTIGAISPPDTKFNANDLLIQANYARIADDFTMADALSQARTSTLLLSTDMLNESGLSDVDIITNGNKTFAADADLRLQPGSSLRVYGDIAGTSTVIDGSIRVAGGTVTIGGKGPVTVKAGAKIDVCGQWTNEFISGIVAPSTIKGGSISLTATGSVLTFESGSVLAADAGATIGVKGGLTAGKAGSITLEGSRIVGVNAVAMSAYGVAGSDQVTTAPAGGRLQFLNAPSILIAPGGGTPTGTVIGLDPTFFDRGGFSEFAFSVAGIADGVTLAPKVQTRVLPSNYLSRPTGTSISDVAAPVTLSDSQRPGVGLNMQTTGDFVLGANTVIATGIGGRVSFNGTGDITIAGKIDASAGSISVTAQNVTVASTAQLLARGATRIVTDIRGVRSGSVLNGGSVGLVAQSEINVEAGSLIDVSGTSGVIDILQPRQGLSGPKYRALTLASSGGAISISGAHGSVEGTLIAKSGGTGASGGTIAVTMLSDGSGSLSPRDRIKQILMSLEPSCWDLGGGGTCDDLTDWEEGVGFDYGPAFGYFDSPIAFSQALIDALASGAPNIVLSETASAGGVEVNPADYGLTPEAVQYFIDVFDPSFGTIFQPVKSLLVRPSTFQSGGFSNLALRGSNVELDGVNLSLSGSIQVEGSLINRNGTTSRLAAPLIQIGGLGIPGPAATLAGQLTLKASLIDVGQAGIRGYAQTNIETTDLRLGGDFSNPSRLDVDGDLVIAAGQIYPTTQTSATITAGSSITILPNGGTPPPLSAGGTLTLSAPIIDQRGTLRAPFGEIVLDASNKLTLAAGSITSVSGAGLTVPYGYIVDQVLWHAGNPNSPITSPPEKRVTLKSPNVDTQSGAVIDLSGGGDLQAYQFIPGSGGSSDYLNYGNAVAILPVSKVSAIAGQEIIHLDGGNGVPAGDYVVMPANYALLPGAYRLEALAGTTDYIGSMRLPDGSVVVSGWGAVGGTDVRDARTRAYKVSSIDTIRLRSEYKIWSANDYFASTDFVEAMRRQSGIEVTAIPRLPEDAGALQIEATVSAVLNATLLASAEPGSRGAVIDISADKIAVAGGIDASSYQAAGYLVLDAASLSAFGGESVLLGGKRRQTINGLEVDATASSLVVATDGTEANALVVPEILLASEDSIHIANGSIIEARGTVGGGSGNILIKPTVAAVVDTKNTPNPADDIVLTPARDYGAFVRVSNGEAVNVIRDGAQRTQGTLAVDAATLRGKSILLDATMTTTVSGSAALLGKVLDVSSGRISIGMPPTVPDGLVLSGGSLAALMGATDLRLRSYSSIDFYGDVALGGRNADGTFTLGTLLLDSAALNAGTGTHVAAAAGEVAFTNTRGGTNTSLGGTDGTLAVVTNTFSLGAGRKAVDGFGTIQVAASSAIVGRGAGSTDFGSADLAFSAARLTAESGASQDWTSTGTFTLAGAPASGGFETLGARLAITAASITQGGLIDMTAGSLTLRATSGDVTLTAGSVTRAAGFSRAFYDQRADIAGGTVALMADHGQVWAQAGSLIDVSRSGNGAAGTLAITTPQREARLDGGLRAGGGGNLTLDVSAVTGFGALSAKLRQSGFDGDLSFRLRAGDVILDGETRAHSFALATDTGSITVTGTIDASGAAAGSIRLSAKQNLTVASGAMLRANASDAKKSSGLIELAAAEGNMSLETGATIEALGGRNVNGEIRLRFKRYDTDGNGSDDAVKLVNASATMTAAKIVAEAYRAYGTTSVDASLPGALVDAANFMSAYAADIEAGLGRDNDATFHLVPGIELTSTGDLTLSSAVDMHDARYNGEAGVLTLRAAENLVLTGSLSDGFDSAAANAAVGTDTQSWSYRLVGGADLDAANPLAVRPLATFGGGASGNVGLGSGAIVRTGTGSISIAAGNDVVLADKTSVVYTAGAKIADPTLGGTYDGAQVYDANGRPVTDANGNLISHMPVFTQGGGDVVVTAQNDIKTLTASDQMIVDWLWREGVSNTSIYPSESNNGAFLENKQTAWWINFSNFQQGIAALGGGNVTVEAGRDIVNVSASTPTQGRVGGGRTAAEAKTAAITGGGDLTVKAGGDIVGGVYYVDQGTGTIEAGGSITSNRIVSYDVDPDDSEPAHNVPIRTVLALGDAALTVTAGGTIDLASASNPTRWMRSNGQVARADGPFSVFSTYGENTALTLLSTGGNVTLWNTPMHYLAEAPAWADYYAGNDSTKTTAADSLVYYPGRMTVIAAAGDITIEGGMVVAPSATGNLDLWAQNSINLRLTNRTGGWTDGAITRTLVMSDISPDKIGSVLRPMSYRFPLEGFYPVASTAEARGYRQDEGLLHAEDYEPSRIYANEGSITEGYAGNGARGRSEYYAEQVWFRAGRDINNLNIRAQNNHASDLSLFWAGRDINLGEGKISIEGPGFVLAEAGRDVFLGRGGGIETVGNGEKGNGPGIPPTYSNPALPRQGADLLVLAGTADDPRYSAFVAAYLDPANLAAMPDYLKVNVAGVEKSLYLYTLDDLATFMRKTTGDAALSEPRARVVLREAITVELDGLQAYLFGVESLDKLADLVRKVENVPGLSTAQAIATFRTKGYAHYSKDPIYLFDLNGGDGLLTFMRGLTGNSAVSDSGAFPAFQSVNQDYKKFFIDKVLSRELRQAGRGQLDGLGPKGLGYERGYAAIATLFPGAEKRGNTGWQGDVIMDVSMIRTYLGGDVDIVAPGGIVQVSALSSNATGDKNGILTINGGEIRITTGLGTIINKSRVLTARGGDITIWSTFGDIDAGKGKKSALTNPPSSYLLSPDGTISYEISPSFTGSGISTQKGAPDAPESDVDLYAPSGIINAGDAGIQVSGNVFLGALLILGAENISAGGEVKGLPPAESGTGALTIESDANKDAADAAKDATQSGASAQPSVIIVEVLGYGGGDGSSDDEEQRRRERDGCPSDAGEQCRREHDKQSYNERSPYQVLGVGALTDLEAAALAAEKRAELSR